MTFLRLLGRNLLYHRRGNLAVFLGIALGSAVLTGALLVGDSLRGSLRELTLDRLGWGEGAIMNKPELIIFDLGRVLVDFDFRLVIKRLKRYTHFSEKEIRRYFMQTPLWDAFERGEVEPDLVLPARLKNAANT